MSNSHGTEIKIWAGFGCQLAVLKKWAKYEQLLRTVFLCFHGQKKNHFLKHNSIRTEKLHFMSLKKKKKKKGGSE